MKIKNLFSHRVTSLLLVFLLAFTMLPTGALAAEVTDETHVHTEECSHEESVETLDAVEDETVVSEPAAVTYEIASDTEVTEVTEETTEDVTETETAEDATSGYVKESSVEWSYDSSTGRLIISGSGDCAEFTSADDQPWIAYRNHITEVWFYDMDALSISNIAYWFDGCSALTMAEIPYTTPVIGTRAFADCSNLKTVLIYHDGGFSISAGAFVVNDLMTLEVRYIPSSSATASVLSIYDWGADNRAVYYEDVYGLSLLATGTCSVCKTTCSYTVDYEYWTEDVHCIRHWCSNCGYDQCGGVNAGSHTYSNSGTCTLCGYYNSAYDNSVCYHTSTYYSWSGCTYYEYCSNCGEYISSGTSHGSTYTEWSGCDWYEYCRDCDELLDYGTSHGSYSYGAWEYYNSSRHRRYYSCDDCGEGSYSYGYHSTTTTYTQYSSTQHKYGKYCSTCGSYVGSTSYGDHTYTYGSWSNYSSTQHRRTKTCSLCGYSTYEYASHSLSYGSWTSNSSTQHKRTVSCSCGYSTTEYASHSLTYGDWTTCEGTNYSSKHQRTVSCSCGYSTVEYEDHSCYGVTEWEYYDTSYHKRYESCDCGYNRYLYDYHSYTTALESISDTEHSVIKTCSDCGHSTTTTEAHSFTYGDWSSCSDTQHQRTVSCSCGYSGTEYGDHTDEDDDGYCDDCSYLMTRFSVTVPANLSLTVSKNGEVYSATSAEILNNSTGAVAVTSIVVSAENGWSLAPYSTNMANEKVDTKQIGFSINGAETISSGATETLNLTGNWTIAKSDSLALSYDAVVSAMSDPVSEQVLTIVFVVDWAA
jgi:hypothetical protein